MEKLENNFYDIFRSYFYRSRILDNNTKILRNNQIIKNIKKITKDKINREFCII